MRKVELSLMTLKKLPYQTVEATIKANNEDEARSYFKGRFGSVGKVVKQKAKTQFVIKGKYDK